MTKRKLRITHHRKKGFIDDAQDAIQDAVHGFIKQIPSAIVGGIFMLLILKAVGAL